MQKVFVAGVNITIFVLHIFQLFDTLDDDIIMRKLYRSF